MIIIEEIIFQLIENLSYGFQLEKETLNINHARLNFIISNWDSNYKKRNHLFDSLYDYSPLIGYFLSTGDKHIFRKYKTFFQDKNRFSHIGQVINDISDFSSIHDKNIKSYQDSFSDIRNGIITHPVHKLIKEKEIKLALKKPSIINDIEWKKTILKKIKNSTLVKDLKIISKQCYIDHLKFWKQNHIKNSFLFQTYNLLLNNKYFISLSQD